MMSSIKNMRFVTIWISRFFLFSLRRKSEPLNSGILNAMLFRQSCGKIKGKFNEWGRVGNDMLLPIIRSLLRQGGYFLFYSGWSYLALYICLIEHIVRSNRVIMEQRAGARI